MPTVRRLFVIGRVVQWAPGERLVLSWRLPNFADAESTEVDVRFEPIDGGTRVSVEHRGWSDLRTDHPARHGKHGRDYEYMKASLWADPRLAARATSREPEPAGAHRHHREEPTMNQTITPYITVNGAAKAIEFYKKAFGAVETAARYTEPNGRVGHAEIAIGGARLMLSDEHPEIEVLSPPTLGGTPAMFHLTVPDAAVTVARAAAEGATVQRAVQDQPYGERSGTIKDPFGHRWMIATHIEDVSKRSCRSALGTRTRSPEFGGSFGPRRLWGRVGSDSLEPSLARTQRRERRAESRQVLGQTGTRACRALLAALALLRLWRPQVPAPRWQPDRSREPRQLGVRVRIRQRDAAVMALDDRLDDREAKAGAARSVACDTVKALEHALALAPERRGPRRRPAARPFRRSRAPLR